MAKQGDNHDVEDPSNKQWYKVIKVDECYNGTMQRSSTKGMRGHLNDRKGSHYNDQSGR